MFKDATREEVDDIMQEAAAAARTYRRKSLKERKYLMHAIASKLENNSQEVVHTAMAETNLPQARLKNEMARTVLQMRQYGDVCAAGEWMDIRINTPGYQQVQTDIRKMRVPLGPVVVFGSSNFPFAYSTAGGDTACALAAGCPVIVKAHPAHAKTSQLVANMISKAVEERSLPAGVFSHVHGASFDVSKWLVMHHQTMAVGFTGSLSGGRQLYDWGAQRKTPIPVFSEMGSTNPVFLLPGKLKREAKDIAARLASSVTTNAGQFCTKPGIIIALDDDALSHFQECMKEEIEKVAPQEMLHSGIAGSYEKNRNKAMKEPGVSKLAQTSVQNNIHQGEPFIVSVQAEQFIENPLLHQEVFGPFSIIIRCAAMNEMLRVANSIDGQLTATIIGDEHEIAGQRDLIDALTERCGRFVINGVPTGVTVCQAMHHGGPYPATTDSRFTSVGADGILRFTRPVCYQNWPDSLLPDELKEANPLGILRMVNGEFKR